MHKNALKIVGGVKFSKKIPQNVGFFVQKKYLISAPKLFLKFFLNFADFYKNISVAKNFFRNLFQILIKF